MKTIQVAITAGLIALGIGIIAFSISWNIWGGGMPGYKVFLFPGNLTLIYFWHPIFTEEVSFWPKLCMLLFGQFFVVSSLTGLIRYLIKRLK